MLHTALAAEPMSAAPLIATTAMAVLRK